MFIGGFTIKGAAQTARRLGNRGIGAIIDFAREGSRSTADVKSYVQEMEKVCRMVNAISQPQVHVALKMSSFINESHTVSDTELYNLVAKLRAPIMYDAETPELKVIEDETYSNLIRTFPEHIIYKTIQAYRVDSEHELTCAVQQGFPIKLVRGAYWQKENELYYQRKEDTDTNYNKLARILVLHSRAPFCIATHNKESIKSVLEMTHPHDKRLMFAQLLGMGDRISRQLAWDGYKVYKYVPYGSLNEMTPYLARRLVENWPILTHVF
jgi:proline dehydrogenase